jgi:hypothetical protein
MPSSAPHPRLPHQSGLAPFLFRLYPSPPAKQPTASPTELLAQCQPFGVVGDAVARRRLARLRTYVRRPERGQGDRGESRAPWLAT